MSRALLMHARQMIKEQDLSGWSAAHDRVVLAALDDALSQGEPVAWIGKHGVLYYPDEIDLVPPINEPQPLYLHPAPSVNTALLEALKLALDCHGKMLLSDPPQEAWKYHRVEQVARAAIAAAEGKV